MDIKLDIIKLKKEIKNKRGKKSIRTISKELNISASTFSRIEQLKTPSMITFIKLCSWLNIKFEEFIIKIEKPKIKIKQGFETKMYEIDGDTVTVDEPLHKVLNVLGKKFAKVLGFEIGDGVDLLDPDTAFKKKENKHTTNKIERHKIEMRCNTYYKLALTAYLFNLQTGELE